MSNSILNNAKNLATMATATHKPHFLRFLLKQTGTIVTLVIVGAFLLALLFFVLQQPALGADWKDLYADYIDPWIAIGTLLAAGAIWIHTQIVEFRASWPQKMHVVYALFDWEKEQWTVHAEILNAPLNGPSEIRNWGQNIARTFFKTGNISAIGFQIIPGRRIGKQLKTTHYILFFLEEPFSGKDRRIGSYRYHDSGATWEYLEGDSPTEEFPHLSSILLSTPQPQPKSQHP